MRADDSVTPYLSLQLAVDIIGHTLDRAREQGVPPLTVVVLDDAGHLVAAQRQDGASMFRFDIALGKAWGVVAMGVASREIAELARGNPNFFTALAATGKGRFLPQPGAVPVRGPAGQVLGAVGASGGTGDQDEECCSFALTQVGLAVGALEEAGSR